MKDFLIQLRTERKREISCYEKNGYIFDRVKDKNNYFMIRKISVEGIEIGVQVSASDYYFCLIINEQNAYFSVYELYRLLHLMTSCESNEYVISYLQQQIDSKSRCKLRYEDIDYKVKKSIIPDKNKKIKVEESSEQIDYKTLFILLNLMQEKSNSLFGSSIKNKDYKNGMIRLLITLIGVEKDNPVLRDRGWVFDHSKKRFNYDEKKDKYKNKEKFKKYNLTKGEKDSIMSIES